MLFRSLLLWAGVCLVMVGCGSSPQRAHDNGVDWLVTNQNEDGTWGTFASARPWEVTLGTQASHDGFGMATSALATLALHEPSKTDPTAFEAMVKGLDHLLTQQTPGRATGGIFYDTWAHTYMLQCVAVLYRDERLADRVPQMAEVIEREIDILADRQAADGGWCYYDFGHSRVTPTGMLSTSFNTAAVLIAFEQARRSGFDAPADVVHDALAALARLRFPSGGYAYSFAHRNSPQGRANKIQGSIGRSQVCNLALYLYNQGVTLEDLERGVEQMRTWHHYILIGKGRPIPHEGWYATAGYYFMFGHYYAGLAIEELPDGPRQDHARWLAQTLRELQDEGDSWFDFPVYGYGRSYATAFGVLALQAAERAMSPNPVRNSLVVDAQDRPTNARTTQ
ncbi:MAG: prenyltransferase/squalene oxidase repeat-containing protein [Planctomycetota bacterium]